MDLTGLLVGVAFGAALLLAGLADPDKILGALRLKDLHAIRVIAVFLLVGMVGVWALELLGLANLSVKPAVILSNLVGGALLGIGFGLTGYCPGTGLACAAAGRLDALVSVLGMFVGALVFILVQPWLVAPMETVADWGKVMLPDVTPIPRTAWVLVLAGGGALLLWATRPRRREGPSA